MVVFDFPGTWCCLADQVPQSVMQNVVSVESSSLLLHSFETECICLCDDSFTS